MSDDNTHDGEPGRVKPIVPGTGRSAARDGACRLGLERFSAEVLSYPI